MFLAHFRRPIIIEKIHIVEYPILVLLLSPENDHQNNTLVLKFISSLFCHHDIYITPSFRNEQTKQFKPLIFQYFQSVR